MGKKQKQKQAVSTKTASRLEMIPMRDIVPSDRNPRIVREGDPAIAELAESIKAQGLLQPVICRPLPEAKEGFELLAGRRRYEAHKLLGREDILAIVSDLNDEEAMEVTVTENMQRSDLTPMEEARGVTALMSGGADAEEVAARLGKSAAWVRRRARLTMLSEPWREVLESDMDNAEMLQIRNNVGVAVLETIAALPIATQYEVLERIKNYGTTDVIRNIKQFRRLLSGMTCSLRDAPWGSDWREDGNTSCAGCVNRSDRQPDLFVDAEDMDEDEDAQCLDEKCFRERYSEWAKVCVSEASRKAGAAVKTIGEGYGLGSNAPDADLREWQCSPAKKTDRGAIPAVRLTGEDAGKLVWVKEHVRQEEAPKKKRPTRALRLDHMIESFNGWVKQQTECPASLRDPCRMLVAQACFGGHDADLSVTTPDEFDAAITFSTKTCHIIWGCLQIRQSPLWNDEEDGLDKAEKDLVLAVHACGLEMQDFVDAAHKAVPK